jgi:hypothetical protein
MSSLGSPRMLHGHLHQLHASSSIHQLHVESPGFSQNVTILTGEFTTVQVDMQQPYVHYAKKVPEYRYHLY